MVPVLYSIVGKTAPQVVLACSLGVIFINAMVNLYHYARKNYLPNYRQILTIGIAAALGSSLATQLTLACSGQTIKLIFAICLVGVLLRTLLVPKSVSGDIESDPSKKPHFSKKIDINWLLWRRIIGTYWSWWRNYLCSDASAIY